MRRAADIITTGKINGKGDRGKSIEKIFDSKTLLAYRKLQTVLRKYQVSRCVEKHVCQRLPEISHDDVDSSFGFFDNSRITQV